MMMTAEKMPKRFTLKYRIFLFNVILVFITMGAVTWLELRLLSQEFSRRTASESARLEKLLGAIVPTLIVPNSDPNLSKIFKKLISPEMLGDEIVSISVLDAQNRVIVSGDREWRDYNGISMFSPSLSIQKALKIAEESEPIAYVRFVFSTAAFKDTCNKVIRENMFLVVVLAILAFFAARCLAALINKPLYPLIEAVESVAEGATTKPPLPGGGDSEIGTLISAFNRMTETIGIHLEDLRCKNALLDKRVFELSTLHQASRAINSVLNLDQLYERIVDTAISVMGGVKRCSLMIVDRRANEFLVRVAKGLDVGLLPPNRRIPIEDGVAASVFRSGESIIVNDVPKGNALVLETAHIPRSSLCVPLKVNDEVFAVLSIMNKISGEAFDGGDQALLEALAIQAGVAIKNARIYQDLNRKILELNTLHDIGRNLGMEHDIQKLLEMIVDQTSHVLGGVRSISLMLYDEASGKLRVRVHRGLSPAFASMPIEVGEGIAGKVFAKGEPMMINDQPTSCKTSDSSDAVPNIEVGRSSLCVPLIVKEHTIGVLAVSEKLSKDIFDENDLSLLMTLAAQISIAINNARLYEDLEASYLAAVRALANSLDAKDAYTRGHSERVAAFSVEIGRKMNLDVVTLKNLQIGALLHDIGKIGISESIINKPSRLTADEYEVIKTHPVRGANIIEPAGFLKEKLPLIKHHHERFDGKGYPDGLSGENIPLLARIVCVADSWDAMTSKRAYRSVMPREQAVQELVKCAGTQFDPKVVTAFLDVLQDEKTVEAILALGYS